MKDYACIKCGRTMSTSECLKKERHWTIQLVCPTCSAPVCVTGERLIVMGVLCTLFLAIIVGALCFSVPGMEPSLGVLILLGVLIPFLMGGIVRMIRQRRAGRASASVTI